MKFLVDANLSPQVAARLSKDGHEASHVRDHGLLKATDQVIARFAVDLPRFVDELASGAVVSFVRGHLRVRRLPLRRRDG